MIIPKDIAQKYFFLRPHFETVKKIIDETLINYSSNNHFAYTSRIKELDSLAEKIESGRYRNWASIDDFIGAVIIIPNINYEPAIIKFLETSFTKVQLKKRGSTWKNYDVFRFDSTRFIGKLSVVDSEKIINTINFEIQIRSAFEHAWSVTTHDLAYKSKTIDWKMLRLAAQLKSSVEQLDMITLGAYEIKSSIQAHKWPETEIKIKTCNFFEKIFIDEKIPEELKPKDMSRFSENLFSIISNSLSINRPKKWNIELTKILTLFENSFIKFMQTDFPMSLSLYQLCFGILLKENILSEKISNEHPFHKSDLFNTIFPECKDKRIKEFVI
jgi:ppGpp synthetase/RelA/SpoT-type nucleotidyltranferase